ncbi:hypothetical protein G6F65_022794 [Rhizopus arrhizus]|nr:hypothetical protein G6F65_022794 [Rhizopus arrhizus]
MRFGDALAQAHQVVIQTLAGMLGIERLYSDTTDNVMPWIKAYADNFTETKTDFFEMRNASYKKTNVDNGFDDL